MKKVCILGAGNKHYNIDGDIVRVDIIPFTKDTVIVDLAKAHWSLPSNEFDVVIAEHIAEHFVDKVSFVKECVRICRDGATIIIEVPNWSHISAHNTLEHKSTFGRASFTDSYINDYGKLWKCDKVEYRVHLFNFVFYVRNEFIGRQIDRFTRLVSGLRFYLKIKK